MYFCASKELEDIIVRELRTFFQDTTYYGSVFNKDFSILGIPNRVNKQNQPVYLISAEFPESFRYSPSILVRCAVQQFHRLDLDNVILQKNEINEYGKEDLDCFYRGGHITLNVNVVIRSLDKLESEQIADLAALWSADHGWRTLKDKQIYIQPFTYPSGSVTENMKDSTDQKKIYKVTLGTTARLSWIVKDTPNLDILEKITVSVNADNSIDQL